MLERFVHGCEHTALVANTVLPEFGCTFWTHPAHLLPVFTFPLKCSRWKSPIDAVTVGTPGHAPSPAFLGESVGPRKEQAASARQGPSLLLFPGVGVPPRHRALGSYISLGNCPHWVRQSRTKARLGLGPWDPSAPPGPSHTSALPCTDGQPLGCSSNLGK